MTFYVDVNQGPARQYHPPSQPTRVSEYVYGINGFGGFVASKTKFGLIRQGGDAYTDWNWVTNFTDSGNDYCFNTNPGEGGSGTLAGAIVANSDSIPNAQAKGEAFLATVPILDFVSSNQINNPWGDSQSNPGGPNCPGNTSCGNSYGANTGNQDFASQDPGSSAFVANHPSKSGTLCTCPGPNCGSGCTPTSPGPVYQDEFVNYLKVNYGSGAAPIFFQLDNEPNYWGSTHPEVWGGWTGSVPCQQNVVTTYDDIVNRNVTYATAIKSAWPQAQVYGPVVAQDGIIYAHSYSDPHLPTEFVDYYLQKLAAASTSAGHPLVDVFDVHWYTVASDPATCVQVPRMFWDPNYTELSPSQTDAIDMGYSTNEFDDAWYPRQIIPRLLGKIASAYPAGGTAAPGLSFSEYNAGCELSIEGGVAEADLLGIFGREGATAAMAWPLQSLTNNYLVAAYDAFRNYDGNGATVGDTAVRATTSDGASATLYAFTHSDGSSGLELVAINKTNAAMTVGITLANASGLSQVSAYQLVDGDAAVVPTPGAAPSVSCSGGSCTLAPSLPAMSVTTLILR